MTKEKAQARREHLARMRAEQQRKERRTAFLMWGAGGLVIVLLVGLVAFYMVNERAVTSLDNVTSAKYVGSQHTQTKVVYKESPPLGGEHNPAWQNCGIYDQPINNETAVHSMEHGAVWITYRPDLPKAELDTLKDLASKDYMLLSPYPELPSKVVASSWNKQLKLDSVEDPRLPKFITKYKNGPDTPELGASCSGGVGTTAAETPIPATAPSTAPSQSAPATDAPVPSSTPAP
ncbi:DUF3105 domain-containing protein [Streptosporangium sp. NBC_01755]|uniref:DUF3105 domain-containing protein n=1 Tax=unclassified Streptosporangium TaxID=2632669 RepID=UPI002DDA9350|nr:MULTISPECIES: DUF3105 domain-containing protein [unclassified Streptosporangium]WSA23061.1 DUF3105 domain-containing protein [Streptosporangium sp. NBC_01810]WSC98796.1 DUF3105 domain-containing protein [Streptosporangium sp. NBC_01755]